MLRLLELVLLRRETASNAEARIEPNESTAMQLHVNGSTRDVRLDPRTTMLDALRETLHLTGSKKRV